MPVVWLSWRGLPPRDRKGCAFRMKDGPFDRRRTAGKVLAHVCQLVTTSTAKSKLSMKLDKPLATSKKFTCESVKLVDTLTACVAAVQIHFDRCPSRTSLLSYILLIFAPLRHSLRDNPAIYRHTMARGIHFLPPCFVEHDARDWGRTKRWHFSTAEFGAWSPGIPLFLRNLW